MKVKALLGVFCSLALAGSALGENIDFKTGTETTVGSISFAGGTAALVGTNIGIGLVSGTGTPSNDGVTESITSGVLSFTTGALVSSGGGNFSWGSGGAITITGTGPGCTTIGGCGSDHPNATSGLLVPLLSGASVSATYMGGLVDIAIVLGSDTKDPLLVQFFGFDPATTTFQFSGSVGTENPVAVGGGFTAEAGFSTDIKNTATVPDTASTLLLLVMALAVMGVAARRFA